MEMTNDSAQVAASLEQVERVVADGPFAADWNSIKDTVMKVKLVA